MYLINNKNIDYFFYILSAIIIIISILIYIFLPIVYDNMHLGDTLFIANVGWRLYNGAIPVIDYNHSTGGMMGQYVAWAYHLTAPKIKALDYAVLMEWATLAGLAVVLAYRRIGSTSFWALILIITTTILTRAPLEVAQSITRVSSAHSFTYNRFGLSVGVLAMLYVLVPSSSRLLENIGGGVIGGILVFAALTKPTFIVLLPFVVLGLLIQGRLRGCLACILGFGLTLLLFDPSAQKITGSLDYALKSVGHRDDASWKFLVRKAVQLPMAQPVSLAIVIASFGMLIVNCSWEVRRMAAAAILLFGGGLGMAATMGGGGDTNQQTIPLLACLSVIAFEWARRTGVEFQNISKALAMVLVLSFALPHFANTLAASTEAIARNGEVLISDGPLEGYLSVVDSDERGPQWVDQYKLLAEGIEALKMVKNISDYGIIADSGIPFDFALGAQPVLDFPLWPRPHLPEFTSTDRLPAEADLVLLYRFAKPGVTVGGVMRSKLSDEFVMCHQTRNWDIFARRSTNSIDCSDVYGDSRG